jgi:hypothetical protein
VIHPTALRVQERLAGLGLAVEVVELAESTRTAAEAAVFRVGTGPLLAALPTAGLVDIA